MEDIYYIDLELQQTDNHSYGVHLLVQARNYVNTKKFVHIPVNKTHPYGFEIAEDILKNAEPTLHDNDNSSQ
jgi:hypothetical protein